MDYDSKIDEIVGIIKEKEMCVEYTSAKTAYWVYDGLSEDDEQNKFNLYLELRKIIDDKIQKLIKSTRTSKDKIDADICAKLAE